LDLDLARDRDRGRVRMGVGLRLFHLEIRLDGAGGGVLYGGVAGRVWDGCGVGWMCGGMCTAAAYPVK